MDNLRLGNRSLIKNLNTARVLKEIRENGPLSRTEISRSTKLGLSTITKISDDLLKNKLIMEIGEGKSTGGRKPINLVYNYNYGYIIGIKIEYNKVLLSLSDLLPEIKHRLAYDFERGASFKRVRQLIINGVNELIAKVKKSYSGKILGIGIAISGIVENTESRLISSSLLGWQNIDFKEELEEELGINIHLDNDVNCYTLAQNWFGKGVDNENLVCVTIGEGIGSGIIVNDKLYRGASGGAGEIGHMIVNVDGRQCYCGQWGCLETYASEDAIKEYVKERKNDFYQIEEIIDLAYAGDKDCIQAMQIAGKYIGTGLINVIMHHNPEKIILGGKGLKERDFIIPHILKMMDNNWFKEIGVSTELEVDGLGNNYFLRGSAILVLSELLEIPIYKDQETLLDVKTI